MAINHGSVVADDGCDALTGEPLRRTAGGIPRFKPLPAADGLILTKSYHEGEPRRGAGHRAAFWDGFSGKFDFTGPKRSAHVIPGTMSAVCFMAGREFARRVKKAAKATERNADAG